MFRSLDPNFTVTTHTNPRPYKTAQRAAEADRRVRPLHEAEEHWGGCPYQTRPRGFRNGQAGRLSLGTCGALLSEHTEEGISFACARRMGTPSEQVCGGEHA